MYVDMHKISVLLKQSFNNLHWVGDLFQCLVSTHLININTYLLINKCRSALYYFLLQFYLEKRYEIITQDFKNLTCRLVLLWEKVGS